MKLLRCHSCRFDVSFSWLLSGRAGSISFCGVVVLPRQHGTGCMLRAITESALEDQFTMKASGWRDWMNGSS